LVRDHAPPLILKDYELSLKSAFTFEVLKSNATELLPTDTRVHGTFGARVMAIMQSPDRNLSRASVRRLRDLRAGLAPLTRRDLATLRLLFRLGGLRNDPFA
jgi:hypothetical protein